MEEKCTACNQGINDNTQDCPNCGRRVLEERLLFKVNVFRDAIEGWRTNTNRLNHYIDELRYFACNMCPDGGPCDNCPCHQEAIPHKEKP